ncbi:MAG: YceI family protein [Bryobacteraceae bacterium]
MRLAFPLFAVISMSAYQSDSRDLLPSPANRFTLEVEKTGLLRGKTHLFQFGKYRGSLDYNEQKPELSKVHFEIESKSLVCLDTWVSDKDKVKIVRTALDDMLAADKYPTISFVSKHVALKAPGAFEVSGSLSIRGVIQNVTVSVTRAGDAFDGTAVVNMKDFGLKPPTAALGAIGTKELMTVKFHLSPR